jgi:hypothetical protein
MADRTTFAESMSDYLPAFGELSAKNREFLRPSLTFKPNSPIFTLSVVRARGRASPGSDARHLNPETRGRERQP